MRTIKDMIVRRRPSAPVAPQPKGAEDIFLQEARSAKHHVPRPDLACLGEAPPSEAASAPNPKRVLSVPAPAPEAKTPKIWDLDVPMPASEALEPEPAPAEEPLPNVAPTPEVPIRRRATSERVKTRLLGFHGGETEPDVFASEPESKGADGPQFPIGWLVVVDGPGRGASFTLTAGLSTIGRDSTQTVTLDFGDTSISRERHASVAYDEEDNCAYVGHGGKSNIVKFNDKPLLSTEELNGGDTIRIGKTVLRFVAFCTPEFNWIAEE